MLSRKLYLSVYDPEDDDQKIRSLLRANADPNQRSSPGNSLPLVCVMMGKPNTLLALIEHKADVGRSRYTRETGMHVAVKFKETECLKVLLRFGSDANARDVLGNNVMSLAVQKGSSECLRELIRIQADYSAPNNFGMNAMDYLASEDNVQDLERLDYKLFPWQFYSGLSVSAYSGSVRALKFFF